MVKLIEISSDEFPQMKEWPKQGLEDATVKLKCVSFTKVTSGEVHASGVFEIIPVENA